MRKGNIFMPTVAMGLLIIMSVFIFLAITHQKDAEEFFSIGRIQSNITSSYFMWEETYIYYEKLLEYNEYKSAKEFSEDAAVPKLCSRRWKFNSECEPEFRDYFRDSLTKNLNDKYKDLDIKQDIEAYFTDFSFSPYSSMAKVKYEGKIIVKKKPLVDFQDLEQLKSKIKGCLQNNDMNPCNPEHNKGNVYTFRHKVADILNEDLEKEEVYIEFEIDSKDSGLITSIF